MTHGRKKVTKIIEELTIYFFTMGAQKVESSIELDGDWAIIRFHSDYDNAQKVHVDKLHTYLNEPKNEAMEDFYWELAGAGDPGEGSQLILVGMMLDKAEINIGENEVSLVLYKHFNYA